MMARLLPSLGYPFSLLAALGVFLGLSSLGAEARLAAYAGVALAFAIVCLHEAWVPFRTVWRPRGREVLADMAYLALVQMALPAALGLAAISAGYLLLEQFGQELPRLWPHAWPVWLQVALLVLAADLGRYWLHRLAHDWGPLWRLHRVHHRPDKLYALNVGRFHALDKALQFLFDSLPFILLGVAEPVLLTHFVLYAAHGFYQHSNAKVRLGPLNTVLAGPELHRWHHAADGLAGRCNYGNNLIVWDRLFGTRHHPPDQAVGPVGLAPTEPAPSSGAGKGSGR